MPKPLKKPAPAAPEPRADLARLGMAVALADLASARGMTVKGVYDCPALLAAAGLPDAIPPTIAHAAHRIDRDRIDGMLWRCHGRAVSDPVPVVPRAEAQRIVAAAETYQKTGAVIVAAPEAENIL